jgi:cardiolipin synthase A/B
MISTRLQLTDWLSIHGLIVAFGLLIYVLTSHSMRKRRDPAAAISWVLTIALIPYIGVPLYLFFGTRKLTHVRRLTFDEQRSPGCDTDALWPRKLAASMGQPPVASYRDLNIHGDGAHALRSLWEVIDSAERELVLCTFILGRDPMGEALIKRLGEKAREGVSIRLLLDGFGYLLGGGANLHEIKAAGIQVALFGPILLFPLKNRANLRNHRKMVVADGVRVWCGGRNFAAEYFEGAPGCPLWQDLSFDIDGPFALQALALFESDWAYATRMPRAGPVLGVEAATEPFAQLIASGPDQAEDTVHNLLVTACFKARSRIIAVTPYFVPGEALLMALSLAARRDVIVDLVLPRRSNHRIADFARHRALRTLAAAGGRVWQAPYMLHAKAIVIDNELALAGSVNLDSRSLFLNYELMVAFYASADIRRFAGFIETHRAAAERYHAREPGLWRDFTEGLVLWLAYQL